MSTSPTKGFEDHLSGDPAAFSLVLGGPLFQLLRRGHLSDDAMGLLRQRILVISLFAWLPLLVLSALEGEALGGRATMPFLLDVEVHIRFLLALPLLIVAELVVHRRMRPIVSQFLNRDLIPADSRGRFETAIARALTLRNSVRAEVLLILFVYVVGVSVIWRQYVAIDAATWYAVPADGGSRLTLAGVWYGYVSLPIWQFLLCRWYFRLFIWGRLLWQVSGMELRLVPTHPDRVAGLGFLSNTVYMFAPLAVAHGCMVAGPIANRIFFVGGHLIDYKLEIAATAVLVLLMVVGPLLAFAPLLARTKRVGLQEYGALAQRYVQDFDRKWLRGGAPADEALVGSGDIQSLADLGNSFEVVKAMRIVPLSRDALVQLLGATLLPVVPLALTMMPFEELVTRLLGVLF